MPAMPPMAVSMTEVIEKKLSPQRVGMNPPIVDPTIMKRKIIDFELILQTKTATVYRA